MARNVTDVTLMVTFMVTLMVIFMVTFMVTFTVTFTVTLMVTSTVALTMTLMVTLMVMLTVTLTVMLTLMVTLMVTLTLTPMLTLLAQMIKLKLPNQKTKDPYILDNSKKKQINPLRSFIIQENKQYRFDLSKVSKLFSPMKRGQGGTEKVSNFFIHPSPRT